MTPNEQFSFEDAWLVARNRSWISHLLFIPHWHRWRICRPNGSFLGRIVLPVLLCIFWACLPILVNLVLGWLDPSLGMRVSINSDDYPLAFTLAAMTFVMLVAGWAGLRFVDDRRDEFDLVHTEEERSRELERFTHGFFSPATQFALSALALATLLVGVHVWADQAGYSFSVAGLFFAAWPTFLGSLLFHWCLPLPFILDKLLRPSARPFLIPYEPAATHWVGLLARVVSLGGGLIAILAVGVAFVNSTLIIAADPDQPDQILSLVRSTLPVLLAVFVGTAAWFWVIPSWQLTSIVAIGKRWELDRLYDQISIEENLKRPNESRIFALREAFRQVSGSPDSPLPTQTNAQYFAASIGVLLALVLPGVFRTFQAGG